MLTDRLKCFDAIGKQAIPRPGDEPQLIKGKWVYTESKSPVDDSPQIVAALQGESADKILVFRCQENRTDAVFIPGTFFFASKSLDVLIRINSDAPETISMIPGTNNRSLFIPAASNFMKVLPDNAKLFLRATLPNGERSDATFELADVSTARDRVAETLPLVDTKGSEGEAGADLPHANGAGAEGEGEIAVRWLGGIFLLALIAIALAVYSDITMTRCAAGSFFAVLGWCSTYR